MPLNLDDLSADELEAIARRKRENAETIGNTPSIQRQVAQHIYDGWQSEYDDVYLLPTGSSPSGKPPQLVVSGYKRNAEGFIEFTGEARVWNDGRVEVKQYRIRNDGPDGCGGRRTTPLWRPGRCWCTVAPRLKTTT